jgi:peroxiredoxin
LQVDFNGRAMSSVSASARYTQHYRRLNAMPIAKGDRIPSVELAHMTADGPKPITTDDLFAGKKVVLFALPGAFTPTCSASHLPGFVVNADELKKKGVDEIVCLSVNDAFVMDAWGKAHNAGEIHMVADGSGKFTQAVGLELDLVARGMGVRSQRYAMIVDDGKVSAIAVEEPGAFKDSSAEAILARL